MTGTAGKSAGYRWLNHTADVGAVVHAETLEGLFETAAEALADLLTDRAAVEEREERRIEIAAPDLEQLLVRWLTELIGWFEIDGLVYHRFSVRILGECRMEGRAFGEDFEPEAPGEAGGPGRHPVRTGVKAVTYHQLKIRRAGGGWEATVIFDV